MGRPKLFNREEILKKAMPLFWARGFADTGLKDLEEATGVNKSGLYSEFKDKEEIFIESLRYYYSTREVQAILEKDPYGWENIENFFKFMLKRSPSEERGCFGVNSMRELELLPEVAREIINENRQQLKRMLIKNISAEKTKLAPLAISELILTFFSGFCIEHNMKPSKAALLSRVDDFMSSLRQL